MIPSNFPVFKDLNAYIYLMKKLLFLSILSVLVIVACNNEDEPEVDQALVDEELILQYIADNNLNAEEGPEGLYIVRDMEGTGASPTVNDVVVVDYEGFLLDGTKFDSSIDRGRPEEFLLSNLIRGWQLGIPLLSEGCKATFIFPSALAYRDNPPYGSPIPVNAVLVFDIELIEVK